MNVVKKMAAVAAAAAVVMAGSVVTATPAAAAVWISQSQVGTIGDARTARWVHTDAGTVEVRYGTYGGNQYGWGRAHNLQLNYTLLFEVDNNGDRHPDEVSSTGPNGSVVWTQGATTTSSSDRAFRACLLAGTQSLCKHTHRRTNWW